MRVPQYELHEFTLDCDGLVLEVRRRERVMGPRRLGRRAEEQQHERRDEITLHN